MTNVHLRQPAGIATRSRSLVELLRSRAAHQPQRLAYTFLDADGRESALLTYARLDRRARGVAALLQERGAAGERVLLLYPHGPEYLAAFVGCLYAGAVAVPAYPPRFNQSRLRLEAIVADAQATLALTTHDLLSRLEPALADAPQLRALDWVATDAGEWDPESWREPGLAPGSLAYLQYTSGSTGTPKGVRVTHANLLHNESRIAAAFGQTESSVIVSWLPLYHDMGLIGGALQPLYLGARSVLLSPTSFLQRPARWLEAISRYRATTSGGPNFAYELCARRVSAEQKAALDLGSWAVAFNGAEPVRAETLDSFAAAFRECGFRGRAFAPCYGLAEATLLVAGGHRAEGPLAVHFDAGGLREGRAVAAPDGEVGSRALLAYEAGGGDESLVVVDPETLTVCSPGRVGEVWVASPSVADGYWARPDETAQVFRAHLSGRPEGAFLRTGDLGVLHDGRLFITGRLKDVIVVRGQNHYPQDIELTVERAHPALRPGCGAAFALEVAGQEQLVIAHELSPRDRTVPGDEILTAIRRRVTEEHGLQPHAVALVEPGAIPKTSSGKIQRGACRAAFVDGSLKVVERWSAGRERDADAAVADGATAMDEPLDVRMARLVAGKLGLEETEVDAAAPLTSYGIDSVTAVELAHGFETLLGRAVSVASLLRGASLADLAAAAASVLDEAADERTAAPTPEVGPLSHGQRALWFLRHMESAADVYTIARAARVRGALDVEALRHAFQRVVDRHPCLRTTFESRDGEPVQRVHARASVAFRAHDAVSWDASTLHARLLEQARRPFDLERGPLLRVDCYRRAAGEHVVLLAIHHIVADFWSLAVLTSEVGEIYRDETRAQRTAPVAVDHGYADHVRRQSELLASAAGEKLWDYWRTQLAGELPVLELPTDRPRPQAQTVRGDALFVRLDERLTRRLEALARHEGTTLYTVLLAAFQILLWRHSGQDELLVGTPAAGRTRAEHAGSAGYFVNAVVVRVALGGELVAREFLARVRSAVLGALEHQEYPFDLLVRRLQPTRSAGRPPLFQAMFAFHRSQLEQQSGLASFALQAPEGRFELGPLALELVPLRHAFEPFDLTLVMAADGGRLGASFQYNADLFDASTIARLSSHFVRLLEGLASDPRRRLVELPLMEEDERRLVLEAWNDTRAELPVERCVHELVAEWAARTPDALAVAAPDARLSYAELVRAALAVARRLRAHGVGPGARVGVYVERSAAMVVGLLGALTAGAAYLPLDPELPDERLRGMERDAGLSAVLTVDRLRARAPFDGEVERVCVDALEPESAGAPPAGEAKPGDVAYVIYTSGSTGVPKGVEIEHRALLSLVFWHRRVYGMGPGERGSQLAALSFDATVWELWPCLTSGASVHLADDETRLSPRRLRDWLLSEGVTVAFVPTPLAEPLLHEPWPRETALRVLLTGGDRLTQRPPAGLPFALINHYGPTEATVVTTAGRVAPAAGPGPLPSIGRPIDNQRAYVLDRDLRPAPVGVPGELFIGGACLARGYLGRPELTAEKFVPDPFAPERGARLYASGDRVRWRADGEIEFLGRVDDQVKVRGFRIELGEITAALQAHDALAAAATVVREDAPGERRLVAYVVPRDGAPSPAELREFLRARLPEHMLPAVFVSLASLPLTPHGKLDRRALPAPARGASQVPYEAARTPLEAALADIWAEVLELPRVGVHDDFFELGGHSLLVVRVVARVRRTLGVDLPVRLVFEQPTVARLAARVERLERLRDDASEGPIARAPRDRPLPASPAQQRLWFLDQLNPGLAAYNMPAALSLSGALDAEALERALDGLVRRHEALRTTFRMVDAEPAQVVTPPGATPLAVEDLTHLPQAARETEARRRAGEEARRPFDLARGPLFRARLLRLDAAEHVLLLSAHHIVCDGWSLDVLVRELGLLYEAARAGRPEGLPELRLQYADFAHWQRERLEGEAVERQLAYWRRRLGDGVAPLELPADRPRPAAESFRGALAPFTLSRRTRERLEALARHEGATLFMLLLAAFEVLLHRYTGQTDLAVGTPVAGRNRAELEGLVGLFINTLVLRADLSGDPTLREFLARVRAETLDAYAHQDAPFERVVEELQPRRDLSRNPLFQVMFVLRAEPFGGLALPGLRTRLLAADSATSKLDLTLIVERADEGLRGWFEYGTDLFERERMERLAAHFVALVESFADDPGRRLSQVELLSPAERERLLVAGGGPRLPPAQDEPCLHELFERQAARTPAATALVRADEEWSYAALERRANRLARHLRRLGVGPEVRVGVCTRRAPQMVAGLLAVLKAGGAYVPLDPSYPAERVAYMLADSGAALVLAEGGLPAALGDARVPLVRLDDELAHESDAAPPRVASPRGLAYVIYTSGSTGRPKGVAIEHRSAVVFARWARGVWSDEELRGVLASTSICFDLSVFELFVTLAWGGTVYLADNALELPLLARRGEVTLLNTVPSAVAELVRQQALPASVRTVNLAGEPLTGALVERVYAGGPVERVLNLYGPSEDTTYSTCARVPRGAATPSLGRPIAHTRAYVLDRYGALSPPGVPGELHLGGDGLARGYLGRPELTAERFVPDPFGGEPGARLYRTGDLARHRPDGELEFLGRIDQQVKLRGYRIELGEIEAALDAHEAVGESVVLVREDAPGDRRLVAYIVPRDQAQPDAHELRAALARRLPEYMLPAAFVTLAALPRTPNGKLDRRALPAPEAPASSADAGGVAPRTPLEQTLASIWAQVLGRERVGVHDDFFELGGHSLLAMRVAARVRQECGVELPVRALFERPSVARLAQWIEEQGGTHGDARHVPIAAAPRDRPLFASHAQQRLWFLEQLNPGTPVYNMPAALRLEGPLDLAALQRTLDEVVRRHEALRTTFAVVDGQPAQVVAPAGGSPLDVVDLTPLPRAAREGEARRRAEEQARRPFDLAAGPLYRAALLRLDAAEHVLLLTLHHIVCDGWSLGVLVDEVAALYGAFSQGLPSPLPEPSLHYADFAVWQRAWLQGAVFERQLDYWRRSLGHELPALELPSDAARRQGAGRAALHELRLPAALAEALRRLSRAEECSLFMTLLAAFKVLLHRHTRADDVAVGSGIANRARPEFEPLVGFFVNTVVMRTDLSGDPTFRELLKRVRETTLGAYAHQDVPFERVVEALQPERHASQAPFFNICFFLQNAARRTLFDLPGVRVSSLPVHCGLARFDLTLSVMEEAQGLTAVFEYDADLFQPAGIEVLARSFETLLGAVAVDPDRRIAALPVLAPDDRRRVLADWNATAVAYPHERCVHELFAEQVERAPDALALVTAERRMSYAELDARAERVARRLAELGVGLESRVGLFLERSPQAIVSLLGILKSGAAYLPLDPDLPLERVDFMLNDAGAGVVVTREGLLERLPVSLAFQTLCLDDDETAPLRQPARSTSAGLPDALAYVIYTSGSTGRPKGTEVSHRNVVRLVKGGDYAPFRPGEVFLQFAPLSFDASTFEIWGSLLNGATLALMPPEAASLHELAGAVRRHGVTTLWLTAGLYHLMLDEQPEALAGVPWVLAGGEALSPAHVRRHLAACGDGRVVNGYGPTETTTFACCHVMDRHTPIDGTVPIGRPIANTRVYLLDARLEPVPPGALGELFIGGDGVARGYGGRPDLTAACFVPDPFAADPGARLYRTGDLARQRPDGAVEFRGRLDGQVKLRGFRIEPGEIESALSEHPGVKDAVVLPRDFGPGDLRLVAYVVAHSPSGAESGAAQLVPQLRQHVERRLPAYMAPAAYVVLAQLPLTPNGKVDRRALPPPESLAPPRASQPPRSPVEELLAGVFAEVLGTHAIGREDDFFELGGHSLLATQVVSRIREVLGVELPLRALFEAPSVAGLTPRIEDELRGGSGAAPPLRRSAPGESLPLSYAQQRLWFIDRLEPGSALYNCPGLVRLRGRLDVGALERALGEIVRRHHALRTRFRDAGPGPVQEVGPAEALRLEVEDLSGLDEPAREPALQRLAQAEAVRPFDLGRDVLLRGRLVRVDDEQHVLLFVVHHIASDGWSLGVLLREVGLLYDAFRRGEESPLPELELQYGDYAVWQREWLSGDVLERQLAYWRERLAGAPELLELPTDHPRPEVRTWRGAQRTFLLPAPLVERLEQLSRQQGATLFMTLLAAWQTLLGWLSGQEDVVVAAPVANRTHRETEGLIGFFVNMLVLRTDLSGDPSFAELLARVRETALAAFAHQDLPFERLVEELNPERRMSVTPIFQVAFSLQNYPAPELALADLELALEVEDLTINAKIDLNLIMQRSPRGLEASFVYDADLWNADTVQAWADHLTALADRIAADPGVMLAALRQALSDADRERRLEQQQRFENARARGLGRLKRPQAPVSPLVDTRDPHVQR